MEHAAARLAGLRERTTSSAFRRMRWMIRTRFSQSAGVSGLAMRVSWLYIELEADRVDSRALLQRLAQVAPEVDGACETAAALVRDICLPVRKSFSCPHRGVPWPPMHEELRVGDDPRVAGQHVDDPRGAAALRREDDESRHGRRCRTSVGFRAVKAKRVLVTGGAGFIPSNFVRHILESTPYEVVSLDALTYAGSMETSPT